ncbi:isocitrate lyase/PEP mutase family protein [Nocardia terpenica]|uniref:2,3-dimethylmalate lyase n=1 Tax=Nocardia terpenica TaxID=455432 RepID=A0A164MLW3_9NOCA|nr:isocitrate lyase/PEP mutase family protein [Nocardia terpenica]KZM73476.1 2,3-dimethylmalate lyase [Nocardia terpenica]NQE87337.1 isocitrate lyase/PEP mutase family protein [Nocardia terpenica]
MGAADELRSLLAPGRPIVRAPGAFDSMSARLVERAGFPAVYMTGLGATASRLGQPDIGLLTQTEMAEHARNMVRATSIPVVADADTGYGGPSNIHRAVQEYLQAGVAALHLEDQVIPKRCGQLSGIRLVSAEEGEQRIRAAVAARGDESLIIIGRTDALGVTGREDAVDRATRYRNAGADLMFVDGIKTRADLDYIAEHLPGPKVASLVDGTDAAATSALELERMGFSMVFYALTALLSAVASVQESLGQLYADGVVPASRPTLTYAEYSQLVGLDFHRELDAI